MLVRLDAGSQVGHGHAIRTAGVLSLLQTPIAPLFVGDVTRLPAPFEHMEVLACGETDDRLPRLVNDLHPDSILVDLPHSASFPWDAFRGFKGPLIAVDDEGGPVKADLIINGTVAEANHSYPHIRPGARLLLGADYALIRPEFAATPWRAPAGRHVLIVIGSGQRAAEWAHCLLGGGLKGLEYDSLRVVVGASFPNLDRFCSRHRDERIEIFQNLDATELAGFMADSSVALLTGGMVVYEAFAVGVPAVVFPQVANSVAEIEWFAKRKCVIDLGHENGMQMDAVRNAIEYVLCHPNAGKSQSAAGRAIVDGYGMRRVARIVDELLHV